MALLAHRSAGKIMEAVLQRRHYVAFGKMALLSGSFWDVFSRYLTGKGEYPTACEVRTPSGPVKPTLHTFYDLLTLNEIFFREDYPATAADRVIVDIGSNIGLSALYFLTRGPETHCTLFEPDPRNVGRLKENLADFSQSYDLNECAVADQAGTVRFGLDVTSGRYGGLKSDFGHSTMVQCVHINTALKKTLDRHGRIDILKIDTEGSEIETIAAIDKTLLPRIRKIYIEAEPTTKLHPEFFTQKQYGTVCQLINKQPR